MVVLTHWKTAVCKLKVFDLNNDSKHLPNPHISDLFGLSLLLVSVVSGGGRILVDIKGEFSWTK